MLGPNCTQSGTPRGFPSSFPLKMYVLLSAIYGIIIISAVILNSLVVSMYIRGRIARTSFNLLLLNLAVSDLAQAVGFIPYICVHSTTLRNLSQRTANYVCAITEGNLMFWIGTAASLFTMATISVSRYLTINYPMHRYSRHIKTKKVAYRCCILSWIFAFVICLPNVTSRDFDSCSAICKRRWPKYVNGAAYAITTAIVGFALPIILFLICFLATIRTLLCRRRPRNISSYDRRKHVLVLLGALILTFIGCWTPFTVYWLLSSSTKVFPEGEEGHYERSKVVFIVLMFPVLHCVINPILYAIRPSRLRKLTTSVVQTFETASTFIPLSVKRTHKVSCAPIIQPEKCS